MSAGRPPLPPSLNPGNAAVRLAWWAGVGLWMGLCYFPPQWWPLRPALPVPALAWEQALPFMPWWAVVYQSVFLLHCAAFWAGGDMAAVRRYGLSVAAAFAFGAVVFWCWPTAIDRPGSNHPAFRLLISIFDAPRNALPSMHAAMSTLLVIRFWKGSSPLGHAALGLWWLAVLFATLATRQHQLIDLAAGVLLATIIAWRTQPVLAAGGTPTNPQREGIAVPPPGQSA